MILGAESLYDHRYGPSLTLNSTSTQLLPFNLHETSAMTNLYYKVGMIQGQTVAAKGLAVSGGVGSRLRESTQLVI